MLTFGKHEALILAGGKRAIIHIEASPLEHRLATTDPRELANRAHVRQGDQPDQLDQADEQITQKLIPIRNGHDVHGTATRQLLQESKGGITPS